MTSTTSPRPSGLALGGQVQRAGQDAAVVGVGAESGGQHLRVGVVELDVQRPAGGADRHRCVQAAVFDAQLVERAQRRAGEPAQFGMVPLALEFGDDHQRQDDLVLVEPGQRPRVGQQHRGVEHVAAGGFRVGGVTTITSRMLPRGRGTAPTLWLGRPDLVGPPRQSLPRTPARAGCRPPRVQVTPRPGPPRAVRIGYGPPVQTLPAVTRVRSTATRCAVDDANPELTERTTARRRPDTARRRSRPRLPRSAQCDPSSSGESQLGQLGADRRTESAARRAAGNSRAGPGSRSHQRRSSPVPST